MWQVLQCSGFLLHWDSRGPLKALKQFLFHIVFLLGSIEHTGCGFSPECSFFPLPSGVLQVNVFYSSALSYFTSFPYKSLAQFLDGVCVCVCLVLAICPVAVAPAELAALMHHGIILDRCCYLCSVSKPIILTQFYVNTAVSWHTMGFTHAQRGSWVYYLGWLSLKRHKSSKKK